MVFFFLRWTSGQSEASASSVSFLTVLCQTWVPVPLVFSRPSASPRQSCPYTPQATQRARMHPHAGGGLFDKLVCVRRPASIGAVRNLRDTRFWAINQTDTGLIDVKWVKGRMPSTDDPRQSNLELHPSLGASTHTSGLAIKYPLLFVSRFDFLF